MFKVGIKITHFKVELISNVVNCSILIANWYMPVILEKPRLYCLWLLLILKPKGS